jgi:hypothetical protein
LAATLGLPGMPPTRLTGRIDMPIPAFEYRTVLARVLARHSSFASAEAAAQKAKYDLELARRTPIPDVEVRALLQKDRTGAPFEISGSLAVSVPVPVWNRNQGGIIQAQAALIRANELAHQARSDLSNSLADAFERYENGRVLLSAYRDHVLPDLARVYRGLISRLETDATINITDIVVAQQNLATALATYITTLGQMWQAVVDVADPLQTPDLFGIAGPTHPVAEIPDLEHLPGLPCCHPCSPLPKLHQRVLDGTWPNAAAPVLSIPAPRNSSPTPEKLPAPTPANKDDKKSKPSKSGPPLDRPAPSGIEVIHLTRPSQP